MTALASLEDVARNLYLKQQSSKGSTRAYSAPSWALAQEAELRQQVMAMMPSLVQVLWEHRDQPAEQLRPTVRRLLLERAFCGNSGDRIIMPEVLQHLEQQVDYLIDVLGKVRHEAMDHGDWSTAPVTPQMFG